ncbi:hypothetical protein LP43_2116 [Methylophaga thiooxydans]|uniref:Uncharacterized protein n=1 Tax=Methylophaga thiooxydans TaxID=392484 RepID=A0A0A0BCH1_9GAMM|nr:hypothetical protein LP43_2116 [Methylophaga thiooxydans]
MHGKSSFSTPDHNNSALKHLKHCQAYGGFNDIAFELVLPRELERYSDSPVFLSAYLHSHSHYYGDA